MGENSNSEFCWKCCLLVTICQKSADRGDMVGPVVIGCVLGLLETGRRHW